jgi:hypothetical protein
MADWCIEKPRSISYSLLSVVSSSGGRRVLMFDILLGQVDPLACGFMRTLGLRAGRFDLPLGGKIGWYLAVGTYVRES